MKEKAMRLTILAAAMCIAQLGVGILIPVMPQYLEELGAGGVQAGYLLAAMGVGLLVASPLAGRWSDRYGRKKIIIGGLGVFAFSQWGSGLAEALPLVYGLRFLGGIGMAGVSTAVTAYVGDSSSSGEQAAGHGKISAAMTLGIVAGPALGGGVAEFGVRAPFFSAAAAACVAMIVCICWLPESFNRERRTAARHNRRHGGAALVQLLTAFRQPYGPLLLLIALMTLALAGMEAVFGLYVAQKYDLAAAQIAVLITGGALAGAVVQGLLLKRLLRRLSERALLGSGITVAALALAALTIVGTKLRLLVCCLLFFAALSTLRPAVNTLLSQTAEEEQGYLAGLNQAYSGLGIVVGPLVGGALFDWQIDLPFIGCAVLLLLSLPLLAKWETTQDARHALDEKAGKNLFVQEITNVK